MFEPTPQKPSIKRSFNEDFDSEIQEPIFKRRREERLVCKWLDNVPASESKASSEVSSQAFDDHQDPPPYEDFIRTPKSPSAVDEMGDEAGDRGDEDNISQPSGRSSITKIKPTSIRYRSILEYNHVQIDAIGSKISNEVRTLLDTDILKARTSPPLSQELLKNTGDSMNTWGSSTENVVNSFVSSPMFPVHQPGIGLGGNSPWPRAALPYNPDFGFPISTPKPDYHVGYDTGIKSGFSAQQANVINNPQARPYTQPGTGNILPFLTVELKSEATGGTLYHAENQAAGSGTYSQRAMEWLLDQANDSESNRQSDTATFSITGTGRLVVLSVHWHSLEDQTYYMSYVKGFLSSEPEQVQACHSTVKNVIEWGLDKRRSKLRDVLQHLFPLTQQWTFKRAATAAELNDTGDDDDEGEGEEQAVESVPSRAAKSRRSEPKGTRGSFLTAQSITSTQSLKNRRSMANMDTDVSKGGMSLPTPSPSAKAIDRRDM